MVSCKLVNDHPQIKERLPFRVASVPRIGEFIEVPMDHLKKPAFLVRVDHVVWTFGDLTQDVRLSVTLIST